MIYQKIGISFPSKKRYFQTFEYMFIFSKGSPKTFNPILVPKTGNASYSTGTIKRGTKKILNPIYSKKTERPDGNVWLIANHSKNASKDEIAYEHPAIFPEELARKHIYTWSNEGDLIYDPFMGSGTTAKMAILNKRNYIGSEISEDYCEIARKRISFI